jgi:hypothetical protein
MEELLCTQIKADSSKKSDIDGVINDRISNKEERLGFSIKSMVGGDILIYPCPSIQI